MSDLPLTRSLDSWARCTPHGVATGSMAQIRFFVEDAQKDIAALAARVSELEAENKALQDDKGELMLALQPLLGCADYAREQDMSGHELLTVSASEAYEANTIHERVLNRAAKVGGGNNG